MIPKKIRELRQINSVLKKITEEEKVVNLIKQNLVGSAAEELVDDVLKIDNGIYQQLDKLGDAEKFDPEQPLISVNNVTIQYKKQDLPAVINASFRIFPGKIHLLTGKFGSGKTSLIKAICNLIKYEGAIEFAEPTKKKSDPNNNLIGVLFEPLVFDFYKTVNQELIEYAVKLLPKFEAQAKVNELLRRFNLLDARHDHFYELSLLEIRQIMIIKLLLNNPRVIIVDEVFKGLENDEVMALQAFLFQLKTELKKAVLITNPFDDNLINFADTFTILSNSKVYFSHDAKLLANLLTNRYLLKTADNAFVLTLLNQFAKDQVTYKYLEHTDEIMIHFKAHDNNFLINSLQKLILNHNLSLMKFQPAPSSLRDFYQKISELGTYEATNDLAK